MVNYYEINNKGYIPGWSFKRNQRCSELIHNQAKLFSTKSVLNQRCTLPENFWTELFQRCTDLKPLFPWAKKSALNSTVSELIFSESALVFSESALYPNFHRARKSALIYGKLALKHTFLELDIADCLWGRADQRWNYLIRDYQIRGRNNFLDSNFVSCAKKANEKLKFDINIVTRKYLKTTPY